MADRTSAGIFSDLFVMFAEKATAEDKEYARRVWGLAWNYDFSFVQMECDPELCVLGLATPSEDEGFPTHEYANDDGSWD